MGEALITALSRENHRPSTMLSMDSSGTSSHDDSDRESNRHLVPSCPPDINLPLSGERSPLPQPWDPDACDNLDVSLGTHFYEAETLLNQTKGGRKCAKRVDTIWGAWFFFNFYFKPALNENSRCKVAWDGAGFTGFDKSDLRVDVFLVQHDMENMYMWVFKERPENALGKVQLWSYMSGHSHTGEPQFPFSAAKGFVRSHRMQRKQYRGLSNPQCVHGIEVVRSPNLSSIAEGDRKKWMELTGRDINFSIPPEASDFGSWRNVLNAEFDIVRHLQLKNASHQPAMKSLNGSGFNLSTQASSNHPNGDDVDLSPFCNKRRKDCFSHGNDDDECSLPAKSFFSSKARDMEIQSVEAPWLNDFSGVMMHANGPVTAAKSIYEDEEGYLIMVSLPFADFQRVKVSWRNTRANGVVKILCISTARTPFIKRQDRTFKLTDPSPEHCPPGEFVREITLPTRIPEDAKLEAYYDGSGAILEIMVPKLRVSSEEEHEVLVCLRPPHASNKLQLT